MKSGARAYVSIAGGIDVPLAMGSKSTYTRAKIGGFEGRALKRRLYKYFYSGKRFYNK